MRMVPVPTSQQRLSGSILRPEHEYLTVQIAPQLRHQRLVDDRAPRLRDARYPPLCSTSVHTSAVCGAVWDQARWLRRCYPHRQPGPFPLSPPPMRGARLCCPSAVVDGVRGLVSCSRASVTGGGGLVWCVWVGADYSSSVFHRKREKQRNRKTRRSGQRETTADVWLAPESTNFFHGERTRPLHGRGSSGWTGVFSSHQLQGVRAHHCSVRSRITV